MSAWYVEHSTVASRENVIREVFPSEVPAKERARELLSMARIGSVGVGMIDTFNRDWVDPRVKPGEGWFHRIDDVPDQYRAVSVLTVYGLMADAVVIPNPEPEGCIGGENAYRLSGTDGTVVLPASKIAWITI